MRIRACAGLAPALVALAAAAPAGAEVISSAMPGKYFDPESVTLVAGDELQWRNRDFADHTATDADGEFDSGILGRLESYSHRYGTVGEFRVLCRLHSFMTQTVSVHGALLEAPPGGVLAGHASELTGRVPPGTQHVSIEREAAPGSWEEVARAAAEPSGSFAAAVRPPETGAYRAVAAGGASPPVVVRVTSRLTVRTAVRRGRRWTTVRIRTVPPSPGARALVETYNRERFHWLRAATTRLDDRGRAVVRLRAGLRRVARVVISAPGGGELARSRAFKLRPGARGPAKVIPPGGMQHGGEAPPADDHGGAPQ